MLHNTLHPDDLAAAQAFTRRLQDCLMAEQPHLHIPTLARQLQVSPQRLSKWLNSASIGNNFPAYLLPRWDAFVGPLLLQSITHDCGYDLTPCAIPTNTQEAMALTAHMVERLGAFLSLVAPYLETACPHQARRQLHDETLSLVTQIHTLDRWAQTERRVA